MEGLYLALTLYDEAYGHTLHPAGRKRGLHFAPQHGRETEAYQAVEHAACLLCVDQIHVELAWILNGLQYGGLGNLMEDNAFGGALIKSEHLTEVPGDSFSLTVFIRCQPYLFGFAGLALQFGHQFLLFLGYLIVGQQRVHIYADFFFLQVTDVSVT